MQGFGIKLILFQVIILQMSLAQQPIHVSPLLIFRQIVCEAGISNKTRQQRLKQQINKKYSLQMNLLQSHQLRDHRFVSSQNIILNKQRESIQKTKQSINQKQEKALSIKIGALAKHIKKSELNLSRWQQIVQKNKGAYRYQVEHSEKLIKNWNDKLSSCSSRKSIRLSQFCKNLREKTAQKEERAQSTRRIFEEERLSRSKLDKSLNSLSGRQQSDSKRGSRISKQIVYGKKHDIDEQLMQKQLVKTIRKQHKISAARQLRESLLSKKRNQRQIKQQYLKKLREDNLNRFRIRVEQKNLILDKQFKKKSKNSLPQLNYLTPHKRQSMDLSDDMGNRKQIKTEQARIYQHSYDRLIKQKLRDVTMLLRRRR